MQVRDVKPKVGSEIAIDRDDFLSGKYAEELQRLLVERSALVFRGMHLTDEEQLQFARTIGEVFLVGGDQELQNISMDPKVNRTADYTRGAFYWHIDGANDTTPAKATMLSVRIMPDGDSGDTMIANTYAAYADLPEGEKRRLDPIRVRHALESTQRMVNPDPSLAELDRWQAYPAQTHPLVWHHRHGRPSLLIGATCFYVEDMDLAEGNRRLCQLQEYATQDEYVYRHKWSEGDFLIFDNTGTMHKAAPYDLSSQRLMRRTTLVGEEPVTELVAA